MKKITKLLILSLSALTCFSACGNGNNSSSEVVPPSSSETPSSSEEQVDVDTLIADAADYLWEMYKAKDSQEQTGTFDVVNKVVIGGKTVGVSWGMEVTTGTKNAFSLTKKDDNFSTVYIGYFDGKVTEASSVKLTATLSYGDVTKSLAQIFADKEHKQSIDFTTPVLILNNHADWDAAADGTSLTLKGTVVDIIKEESGSSSKGSFYMIDDEGNGYYIYNPTTKGAKPGDIVIVSGQKTIYYGQEETKKEGSYQVIGQGDLTKVPVVNATEDWEAATSNEVSGSLKNKYQNIPVKLEGCTPTRMDDKGTYYYFTVGDGTTEFNIYSSNYFLSDEQINAWKALFEDALNKGYTFTLEGIATVYSNKYQVYPSSLAPHVITKEAELSTDEKHALVESTLKGAIKDSYTSSETISFNVPSYATVTLAVTSPTEGATVAVSEGKLVVTPSAVETTNKVKATVKIGESTKEVELTVKTAAAKGDDQLPENAKTIEEVLAYTAASNQIIQISGVVESIYDTTYGNCYLTDPVSGKQVLVYGLANSAALTKNSDGTGTFTNNKSFSTLDVQNGDYITVEGLVGYYSGKPQLTVSLVEEKSWDSDNVSINLPQASAQGTVTANKTTAAYGDTITLTVTPAAGYEVESVKVKQGYTSKNYGGDSGVSATVSGSNYTFTAKTINNVEVVFKAIQTNPDEVETKVELTPSNFLVDSKDSYVTTATTATIDGIELEFLQMANYAEDGLRMRATKGDCYLLNKTAIESGIKSVSFSILDSKTVYNNTNYMTFEFSNSADFSNAETKTIDTTSGTYDYTITPSVATYKYVRITYNCTAGTCYMDSMVIDY